MCALNADESDNLDKSWEKISECINVPVDELKK